MSGNVTEFPGSSSIPENPLKLEQRSELVFCQHDTVSINEHQRTLRCANSRCGAILDPFDFVAGNAKVIQRAWDNHRHVSAEVKSLVERVHELKKEERRLREVVKRLQGKTETVVTVRRKGD